MNALHRAFQVLGLEPGTAFPQVKKRYRRLVVVWHPDRMNNEEAKREAEEELKKINDAFEKLKNHFDSQHSEGPGCACQPSAADNTSSNHSTSKQGSSRTRSSAKSEAWERAKNEAEAAAKKRSEERARQQAEERAQREAAEAAKRAAEFQSTVSEALDNEAFWKEERLRWKVALGLLVAFVGLIGFCWLGCGAKALAHNIETQWKKIIDSPKKQNPHEPMKKPRTIKIYNEYCPHHNTHRRHQEHRNPPTRDPYFPGSDTWNYRLKIQEN